MRRRGGFTLVELLVVLAITALLVSMIAPALSRTLGSARGFRCQMSLRQIAFDFSLFADEQIPADRGDDLRELGQRRFRLMTFQESLYGLDEFWAHREAETARLTEGRAEPPMRCSEVHGDMVLRRGRTAEDWGAIGPPENISFGFNIRLHRPETPVHGLASPEPAALTPEIMTAGMTPLVWDVDGRDAFRNKGVLPQFSGPSINPMGAYANDVVWFPGARHNGQINVAFIGGQVAASSDPTSEPGWRWDVRPR